MTYIMDVFTIATIGMACICMSFQNLGLYVYTLVLNLATISTFARLACSMKSNWVTWPWHELFLTFLLSGCTQVQISRWFQHSRGQWSEIKRYDSPDLKGLFQESRAFIYTSHQWLYTCHRLQLGVILNNFEVRDQIYEMPYNYMSDPHF